MFFRKKPEDAKDFCRDASLRILKTIRARAQFISHWLSHRPDIKVNFFEFHALTLLCFFGPYWAKGKLA